MTKTKTTTFAVHRFILPPVFGPAVIMIQPGYKVSTIQPNKKGVELYALVDVDAELEPRDFILAKTGDKVDADKYSFVGTVAVPGMKAVHVFETI